MKTIKHLLFLTLLGVLFIACEAEDVISEETENQVNLELNSLQIEENNALDNDLIQDRSDDEDDILPPEGRSSEDEDDVLPPESRSSEDEDDVLPPEGRNSEDEDDVLPPDNSK